MRQYRWRLSAITLGLALALNAGGATAQNAAEGQQLARALSAAADERWSDASSAAGQIGNRVASDIVLWMRLREGVGGWGDYAGFLQRNGDWPGLGQLRRHAERAMPAQLPAAEVVRFFAADAPETGAGLMRFADALSASGRGANAQAALARGWTEVLLNADEQAALVGRYSGQLAPRHVARLDALLWAGRMHEAERMIPLVDSGWAALARARIAVRRDTDGSTALIRAVPASLRGDPGLAFERYLYRTAKGRWEDAEQWMSQYSASAAALGRPEMWMERRANLARQALRRGDVGGAYRLAAQNFGSEGSAYADSEWLAGFIALTYMGQPARAVAHFQRFKAAVFTPISLGRAGYWLGLAHERAGNAGAARAAFADGAKHQTSFYGQLAAERAGVAADGRLAGDRGRPDWRGAAFMRSSAVQAGYWLHLAGDESRASLFWRHAAESLPGTQRAALAQMAIDVGRPHIGIRIAKEAAGAGFVIPNQYYPLHEIATVSWPVPTEFAHAIARQESELNPAAVSPVGARGLMQLMPGTAQAVSRDLGIGYDQRKLVTDPMYNARLGTTYLAQMLRRYDNSYLLASAAYNAGPGRVNQWIEAFGDPRRPDVDPIVWIETIPFEETRNYVMRVLEGLHVYRARIDGRTQPIRLVNDITRAG